MDQVLNTNDISLYHGDALLGLQSMADKSVDLVFYDPPYNVGKKYDGYDDNMSPVHYTTWMMQVFEQASRVSRRGVVIFIDGGLMRLFLNITDGEPIIIHKRAAGVCKNNLARQFHAIVTTATPVKRCRNLWDDVRLPGEGYLFHEERFDNPGMTGLDLTKKVLEYFTLPGETVLDPFSGTGTTAAAAREMGRSAIGIEQSKAYIAMAIARLSNLPLTAEAEGGKITA